MKDKFYVHCELSEKKVYDLFLKNTIGEDGDRALRGQIPQVKDTPISFCSYICDGYSNVYSEMGIIFQTDTEPIYAIPTDSWNLMRSAHWIPGHEKFVFSSLEEMLEKYPKSIDFQEDFKKFFATLSPKDVYPEQEKNHAEMLYEREWLYSKIVPNLYNEVAFKTPFAINPVNMFFSKEELFKKMKMLKQL